MRVIILPAIAFLYLLAAQESQAVTLLASVADDRTVRSDGKGNPAGLQAQDDGYLRTFGTGSVWRSAIEFDISGVSAVSTLSSAVLSLRDHGTSSSGAMHVFGYAGDGVVTVSDALQTTNKVAQFTIVQSAGTQDFHLDTTSFVQTLVAANAGFAGFLLVSSDETSSAIGGSDMCSSEASRFGSGCRGFGPRLEISWEKALAPSSGTVIATPIPPTLLLLLAGFGVLGATALRRSAA